MKPYPILIALAALVLTALFVADCRRASPPIDNDVPEPYSADPILIQDARGKSISLDHSAIKVVSLLPSITEYIFELDLAHLLIGRSDWCSYPESALEVEVVGSLSKPIVERLAALKPDAILVSKMMPEEEVQGLESLGLTVVVFDHQNWVSILRDLNVLGKILGNEGDVKTLVSWLDRNRKSIRQEIDALENKTPIRAGILYSLNPLYTAGAGTFIDELITIAGGTNIAAELSSPWPTLSMEELLQQQPDVLLVSTEAGDESLTEKIRELSKDPVWSQLHAIQGNRVYILDGDTLAVPGPRQTIALSQIASALHPHLFNPPPQLKHVNLLQAPRLP